MVVPSETQTIEHPTMEEYRDIHRKYALVRLAQLKELLIDLDQKILSWEQGQYTLLQKTNDPGYIDRTGYDKLESLRRDINDGIRHWRKDNLNNMKLDSVYHRHKETLEVLSKCVEVGNVAEIIRYEKDIENLIHWVELEIRHIQELTDSDIEYERHIDNYILKKSKIKGVKRSRDPDWAIP